MADIQAEAATFATTAPSAALRLFAAAGVERTAACYFRVISTQPGRVADRDFYLSRLDRLWQLDQPCDDLEREVRDWTTRLPEFATDSGPGGILRFAFEAVLCLQTASVLLTPTATPDDARHASNSFLGFADIIDNAENPFDPTAPVDLAALLQSQPEHTGRHYLAEADEQIHDLAELSGPRADTTPDTHLIGRLRRRAQEHGHHRLEALKATQ
ncbi:hypothetical protein [Streptomyces litchfieldiae]|uniref:Uncharacterized protein n=1 Tax=Streptomyces litchfieldiae TaxID=3075543 RepID=A0ABU2MMR7_9ACTN|nr:hypothetical protein [Streptomyces sp. DSM 44938]MDT0342905.1 hypothetical protein [Streptomyces sp. DSM 44938]